MGYPGLTEEFAASAESTSFVRAFKRWTGVTPARYRASARKRPDLADRLDFRMTKKASPGGAGTG
jgi:hypothetical protein